MDGLQETHCGSWRMLELARRLGLAEQLPRHASRDEIELVVWRACGSRILFALEELIALQGDRASLELIQLQHTVVELGRAPRAEFSDGRGEQKYEASGD